MRAARAELALAALETDSVEDRRALAQAEALLESLLSGPPDRGRAERTGEAAAPGARTA